LEADLDEDDVQRTVRTHSRIVVLPVVDRDKHDHHDVSANSGKSLNLPMHVNGGANLTMLHKTEAVADLRGFHDRGEMHKVPFHDHKNSLRSSAEEICSMLDSSQKQEPWGIRGLQSCVYRLSMSDEAGCMHDLVRLLVGNTSFF